MEYKVDAGAVERWGVFEITLNGKTGGNPFTDYDIRGTFKHKNHTAEAGGFYDGDGVYKVRFMPSFEGRYSFTIDGTAIDGAVEGGFDSLPPAPGNRGPVRVSDGFHFSYEDGTPYIPLGTTCYAWAHQKDELQEETLESLKNSPFNKIRFCVFPKHYIYNLHEPASYPYVGTPCDRSGVTAENFSHETKFPDNDWDFSRFNTDHFRRIEKRIIDLMGLGIEADVIMMHPYDCWGFSDMGAEADDLYWNYAVNRFSAYRNIWWSFANEFDLMGSKTVSDWERYASIVCSRDPYNHLRSIHNCAYFYDHSRPWVTHCSVQRQDIRMIVEYTDIWREQYRKPVVLDEICYEGNIPYGWGNISARELIRRFWESVCRGGYPGHGETYAHPEDILWWSHGGKLHGESPARIAFLKRVLDEVPGRRLRVTHRWSDGVAAMPDRFIDSGDFYLIYLGLKRPVSKRFRTSGDERYKIEIIDTWNMTISDAGVHSGDFEIGLPGREYMAVRMVRQ